MSGRRVRAIVRKELREYRRNRPIVGGMAIIPLVFLAQPLVSVLILPSAAAMQLHQRHELLYMLGIPALVPALLAAYSVVGEREQGTLEPMLTTPIRREELLLGKAMAVVLPSVAVSYAVFALFLACTALFAHPAVASAIIRAPDVIAHLLFTPLIVVWSIWIAIGISTRASEVRVAQQLSTLASLPTVAVTSLLAFHVIHASVQVGVAFAVALLVLARLGWRITSAMFDRERLVVGSKRAA
jgi:ABC-type transport system involved in multi-copper enzyme maturation permease subunit